MTRNLFLYYIGLAELVIGTGGIIFSNNLAGPYQLMDHIIMCSGLMITGAILVAASIISEALGNK